MKIILWIWAVGLTLFFPVPMFFVWTLVLIVRGFARSSTARTDHRAVSVKETGCPPIEPPAFQLQKRFEMISGGRA